MPFIQEVTPVTLGSAGDIVLLQCRFDVNAYDDALYSQLGIAFPQDMQRAVGKRRAEYLAGRHLARQLLQQRGLPAALPTGQHRQPLWPAGWRGSITHTGDAAAVAVAAAAALPALGIDMETWIDDAVAENIVATVLNPAERQLLSDALPFAQAFTLGFSAKESVFKALYPAVGSYFDFDTVEVTAFDPADGCLQLMVVQDLSQQIRIGHRVRVWCQWGRRGVMTLCAGDAAGSYPVHGCAPLVGAPC